MITLLLTTVLRRRSTTSELLRAFAASVGRSLGSFGSISLIQRQSISLGRFCVERSYRLRRSQFRVLLEHVRTVSVRGEQRSCACEQLERDDAHRVDIDAAIERATADLLGRDVARRADQHAWTRVFTRGAEVAIAEQLRRCRNRAA